MLHSTLSEGLAKKWRLAYIGLAAFVAVLYDIFFWEMGNGLGFLLFVLLYIIGFVSLSAATKQIRQPRAFLLLIPTLVMSFNVMLYNNDLVRHAVPVFVGILLILFSLLLTLQNPHTYHFSFSQIPLFRDIGILFAKWGQVWRDLFSWNKGARNPVFEKIAIGVAIAIPILLIFGALLVAADVIFRDIVSHMLDFDIQDDHVWRIFRTGVFTLFLSGFFYVLLGSNQLGEKKQQVLKLDATIVGTVLSLVNVLFIFFVAVQFTYLFGAYEYVRENEIIFAEHARNGFFQLAWVVGLAALMIIFMYRSAVHHGYSKLLQGLKATFITLVLIIAYSALHRMELYQEAYGFTVLRLYVEWTIYFAMAILVFAAGSIIRKLAFRTFFYAVLIAGVVAVSIVSAVNVDRIIARENVARVEDGKALDMGYLLRELSIDALPEVVPYLRERTSYEWSSYTTYAGTKIHTQKYDDFASVLYDAWPQEVQKIYDNTYSWREFNFGIEQAKTALLSHSWRPKSTHIDK
jgi:hypothetical protein